MRSSERRYDTTGFYQVEAGHQVESLQGIISAVLRQSMGCIERRYDSTAVSFVADTRTPLRQEPVLLHEIKGPVAGDPTSVGLRVVLRGTGEVQDKVRELLGEFAEDKEPVQLPAHGELPVREVFDFAAPL